jgi:hypothetical protein
MERKEQDDSRLDILGYSKSRLEIFINGLVFLILHVAYDVFTLYNALPEGFKMEDEIELNIPFSSIFVSTVLLFISYLLLNMSLFGGEYRKKRMLVKHGALGYIIRIYFLILSLVFVSLFLPLYIITNFF